MTPVIYSIGHSSRNIVSFLDILSRHDIRSLLDVRRYPSSRRYPQFNRGHLERTLDERRISYHWLGEYLGGKREMEYVVYMQSQHFLKGMEWLLELAASRKSAFMCAEADFRHCHRRFIAEDLTERGWQVFHIIDDDKLLGHQRELL